MAGEEIWRPAAGRVKSAQITALRRSASERAGRELRTYEDLHQWSIQERDEFWRLVWEDCGVLGDPGAVTCQGEGIRETEWFPGARLSFARNLLRRRDEEAALVFVGEDQRRQVWSFEEVADAALRFADSLRQHGIGPGDRVAAYLPNLPETVIAMLGTAAIGAIWSSCSPDFGTQGVLDRFGQIEPRALIACDGYRYGGKAHDRLGRVAEVLSRLPSVEVCVLVPHLHPECADGLPPRTLCFDDFVAHGAPDEDVLEDLPFEHPLYILYSSGTTGVPKCIVHGQGGTLLQHLKEHRYHSDIHPLDRVFYFTTCGWMMWNWLVSALASEATLVLYDGSPFHPDPGVLFRLADAEEVTFFGTSAKYLDHLAKTGYVPREHHHLDSLRTLASTGSPLVPESFDWVHASIKEDLHLASISGGTDIVSCFVLGDPAGPVHRGCAQVRGLGMDVRVFDEEGAELVDEAGELVCASPFPSRPVRFWNDPEGKRYHAAYFDRFPGVWTHGDWVRWHPTSGMIIFGRSDATLNPGGVRIGTAEIYRQVERIDEIVEAVAVGQAKDGDERIVLFVRLREGATLDEVLLQRIRTQLKEGASPRHVPAVIAQVADIPRTKSGKIAELAVRALVRGEPVRNREAMANPECLAEYEDHPALRE